MVREVEDGGMKLGGHSLVHWQLRGGDTVEGIGAGSFELTGVMLGVRREMGIGIGVGDGGGDVAPFYRSGKQ
jgi:hypothetical protein